MYSWAMMDSRETRQADAGGAHGDESMKSRTVLVFDDTPEFRVFLVHLLTRAGWSAVEYDHPHDFFHDTCVNCDGDKCQASALISDVFMPNMLGTEFVRSLKERNCPIERIALVSGGWTRSTLSDAAALDIEILDKTDLIHKLMPWLEGE